MNIDMIDKVSNIGNVAVLLDNTKLSSSAAYWKEIIHQ